MSSPLLSELGFSPLSRGSSEAFENDTVIHRATTVLVENSNSGNYLPNSVSTENSQMVSMSPEFNAEFDRLEDLKDEIELSLSNDIPISRVSSSNCDFLRTLMNETHVKSKQYALGMSKLGRKFPSLEQSLKAQYSDDGKALLTKVNNHIDSLLAALHQNQPVSQNSVIPSEILGVVERPTNVRSNNGPSASEIIAKAEVKFTTLLNMASVAKQDAEDDSQFLDTASDEKISRFVQKISKYEKLRDRISNSYNDYLEYTAIHKPDNSSYNANNLSATVSSAKDCIDQLIKSLES